MPTPQQRWTDEEVTRLRGAGRSWREISERTGLTVAEAKAAVANARAGMHRTLKERRAAPELATTACTACGTPHGEHRRDGDGDPMCPLRSPDTSFFTTAARQERYPVLHGRYRTDARAHARIDERLAGVAANRSEVLDSNGSGRGRALGTSTAAARRRRRLRRRRLAREAGRS